MTFYYGDLLPYSAEFFRALLVSMGIAICAMAVGGFLGILLYLGKASKHPWGRPACTAYVEVFRNTPVLVQLYLIYFGLSRVGIDFGPMTAVLIGLSLNSAAYIAEIYRGGFESVPKGQWEAAQALGMNRSLTFREVILVQAIKVSFPALTNQLILLFLATSIASIIGTPELMTSILNINSKTYRTFEILSVGGALYYLMSLLMASGARMVESRIFNWGGRSHG